MVMGTPDPERKKKRKKSLLSSHEGFKMIQAVLVCLDYEVDVLTG
jgi:hypothetical protein